MRIGRSGATARPVLAAGVSFLAGRIRDLEAEERASVIRGDWLTASSAVIEKAKLKEIQHQAAAGSRRRV